jgi:hypothetical protein
VIFWRDSGIQPKLPHAKHILSLSLKKIRKKCVDVVKWLLKLVEPDDYIFDPFQNPFRVWNPERVLAI